MRLGAGSRLASYEILRPIGAGGMGEVYRARDTRLARDVAIKVLPPELASDAERLARFEKEARTASALSHPNIVTIYEIGSADGSSYIAMELVDGKTLRGVLTFGPIPLKRILSIATQLAVGLARAHAAGIVHRDLKPENVMVTQDGLVKILDFGLAKLVRRGFESSRGADQATVSRLTEAGTVLGTVGYMSPEQASGAATDFRSDQFSLGAILYEMTAGRRPFERPTEAQTLSAIIEAEPEPLAAAAPKLPASLARIVERCLAKDPEDRYGSTKDLARDLATVRDEASGISSVSLEPPVARRLRVSRAAVAAAALGAAGLVVLAFLAGERLQARRDRIAPAPKRTALTFRRGYLTGARFAPDGQTIVYSACWEGKPSAIFTTRVGSTESRPLGIEGAGIFAISSQGELAVSLDCDSSRVRCLGTLARVPLAGGAPRSILDGVNSADWSPDGRELAVSAGGRIEYPIGRVVYEIPGTGFLSSVRVSPDGKLVAFLDHPQRDSERGILSVVDRAGHERVLTDELARLGPVLWSPTGEEVFFSRWDTGEKRGARLAGGTRSTPWIPGLDDVSRDGLFLDSGMLSENYRGVILARVPGDREERNLSWLGGSVAADLSPDAKRLLLYEEGRDPDRSQTEVFTTFLRATDGSDAVRLGEGRALALSPDGLWALVMLPSPQTHLALLPTGPGEPRILLGGGLLYRRGAFFPDSRRILFTADDANGDARSYIQDVDGGTANPIGEMGLHAVLVSPNGREIAGVTGDGVFTLAVGSGSPARRVGGGTPRDIPVQWSPDGKFLYVAATDGRRLRLYRLDLSTSRRELWKDLAPADAAGFLRYGPRIRGVGITLTPDGQSYAYTYFTDQSRLVLTRGDPGWWK